MRNDLVTATERVQRSHSEHGGAERCKCDACAFSAQERRLEDVEKVVRFQEQNITDLVEWVEELETTLLAHLRSCEEGTRGCSLLPGGVM